jgi:hypothetical protein
MTGFLREDTTDPIAGPVVPLQLHLPRVIDKQQAVGGVRQRICLLLLFSYSIEQAGRLPTNVYSSVIFHHLKKTKIVSWDER